MPYTVSVRWAPIHEHLSSLHAYLTFSKHGKTLELGSRWAAGIRKKGGNELADALSAAAGLGYVGVLLALSPETPTVEAAVEWLAGLEPSDILGGLIPHLRRRSPVRLGLRGAHDDRSDEKALGEFREAFRMWDAVVELLRTWHQVYFRSVDRRLLAGLRADAEARQDSAGRLPPEDVVEDATSGVRLDPTEADVRMILIPQYHCSPWNTYDLIGETLIYRYPVDAIPPDPGVPAPRLLRLTRALGDPSRLRILRFLAAGTRGFGEIVGLCGLAKSTVHHHMMILRAAGLVRTHVPFPPTVGGDRYSLRPSAAEVVGAALARYLKEE